MVHYERPRAPRKPLERPLFAPKHSNRRLRRQQCSTQAAAKTQRGTACNLQCTHGCLSRSQLCARAREALRDGAGEMHAPSQFLTGHRAVQRMASAAKTSTLAAALAVASPRYPTVRALLLRAPAPCGAVAQRAVRRVQSPPPMVCFYVRDSTRAGCRRVSCTTRARSIIRIERNQTHRPRVVRLGDSCRRRLRRSDRHV